MKNFKNTLYLILKFCRLLPFVNFLRIIKASILDYGWFESARKYQSVNRNGDPIPWFNYPAIYFLEQFDIQSKNVFEWGCGNSTLYWAQRCHSITSVESDKKWFEKIQDRSKKYKNAKIVYAKNKKDYIGEIFNQKRKFDIVVIDGLYRTEILKTTLNKVKKDGMIILDNSEWRPHASKYLRSKGFIEIDFAGFGPINPYPTTTSFFIKRYFSFKNNKHRPTVALGGLKWLVK